MKSVEIDSNNNNTNNNYSKYCKKFGFACTEKSYEHFVEANMKVLENNEVKLLWDVSIQTERRLEHNKPEIVVLDKKLKVCLVNDVACPFDSRINKKEQEKNRILY